MPEAIFLSAGVPDPKRGPQYAETADTVAITSAVSSLLYVTLGRRPLVWGGHPAITPMVWVVAQDIGIDYASWVKLYQTRYFEEDFPEENQEFQNVVFTRNVDDDRDKSLRLMRETMFRENDFSAAVFIGGMGGILEEFDMFRHYQPKANVFPIMSTGGAALELANKLSNLAPDLSLDRDYVALFHRHLDISVKEERFRNRDSQPRSISDRYWRPRTR